MVFFSRFVWDPGWITGLCKTYPPSIPAVPAPLQQPTGAGSTTSASADQAATAEAPSDTPAPPPTFTLTPTVEPSPTVTPTVEPSPTASPTPAVLVGAGDIAICGQKGDDQTADLLAGLPGTIFTAGDNSNGSGTLYEYQHCFDPSWGRLIDRIRPSPGNHDYTERAGEDYFRYFGPAAGEPGQGYYSYDLGDWHIVVLNSNCNDVGCGFNSDQGDLAAGGSGGPSHPVQPGLLASPPVQFRPGRLLRPVPFLAGALRARGRAGGQRERPRLRAVCASRPGRQPEPRYRNPAVRCGDGWRQPATFCGSRAEQ